MLERPLEYALIGFKGNQFSGKIVPELLDLAERGIVRFVDIVFISKEKDGSVRTVETQRSRRQILQDVRPDGQTRRQSLYHE